MHIERTEDGWIVRVPDEIVDALGLADGGRVTRRPVPQREDEVRHAVAQLRQRLPEYPFDREDWNGIDVEVIGGGENSGRWTWSKKAAGSADGAV